MKRYLLTIAAGVFMSSALIAQNQKETNVHVIHFDGSELISLDTSYASNSGFTVEDYLNLHGIEPEDAQIIELDKDAQFYSFDSDDVWMFEHNDSHSFEVIEIGDDKLQHNGDIQEVKIMHFMDDDGNSSKQFWVDGEQVDELPADVRVFESKHSGDQATQSKKRKRYADNAKGADSQLMEVEVEVFIDEDGEEHRTIIVNGEEVDELPEGNLIEENIIIEIDSDNEILEHKVELVEQKVEVFKILDDEGNEHVQYFLNGEEVDELPEMPETKEGEMIKIIEIEEDGLIPGHNVFFREGNSDRMTIVLVHESRANSELPETNVNEYKLSPENLSFYPNPNEGRFRIEFKLPEAGRTKISLFDSNGRIVWEDDLGMFSGDYVKDIDVSDKGSGTYIMRITQDNKTMAEKVIVR